MPMQAAWFQAHPDSPLIKYAGNNLYAFNEFLRIVFESGITGLILFSVLCGTGIYAALKGNRQARQAGSLLIAGIGFGLFSYPLSVPLLASLSLIVLAIISQNSFTPYRTSLGKSRWIILYFIGSVPDIHYPGIHIRKKSRPAVKSIQAYPRYSNGPSHARLLRTTTKQSGFHPQLRQKFV